MKLADGTLPSLLDMPQYEEQATKIINAIQGSMFKADKLSLAVGLIDDNKVSNSVATGKIFPLLLSSDSSPEKIAVENNWILYFIYSNFSKFNCRLFQPLYLV